ncbi:LOW QUALITY PROTEIN: glutamate-rich protein 2 [Budorcas taxicolor]|uniref:LOW QUALITY PROTEIN: glutamate-rich protein 2 n=1 Tax=Budorcas taxicolor TaxID=37181 RepID=UPI0022837313|nr:LOW QUALITY PROTEIN: glutamate-rich protein 2 [Budorcas taxicolor]
MLRVRGPQAGKRRHTEHGRRLPIPASNLTRFLPRTPSGPAPEPANFSDRSRFGLWRPTTAQAAREKAPKDRQNGRLLVFDPKEKVMIEPNEGMSDKCLFRHRPRLASKIYTSLTFQVSLNIAKTVSEKKEVSSKNIENKISSNNTKNRISSKSISNKEIETNLQSNLWSSSFLKASTGEMSKNVVIAEQEKNNEHCPEDINDKLSESTDDDGEDTSDEDKEEDSNPNKDTHAPLELMTEFLRAEMGHDYHLAKKLCQMILIYEPENPEAKEFLSLIEEMLLMEKAQNLEEDDDKSEEDNSEREGESTEDPSGESSDECEDG